MIGRRTVVLLGLSQLICWGTSYYLIGGFGRMIVQDTGWSRDAVYGGYSAALLVMGIMSPFAGRLIDAYGGRRVMACGSVLTALSCLGVASSHSYAVYYASWICLGVAMRLTLYDAAFAALARIGGPYAERSMAEITLFGGLASTTFWPVGHALAAQLGWRGAVICFAGFALLTLPLHLALPAGRSVEAPPAKGERPANMGERGSAALGRGKLEAAILYATIMVAANFLNSGMSAHMINILAGLGLAGTTAVWIASLRGIGQSIARLAQILFGRKLDATRLGVLATFMLPFAFLVGLFAGQLIPAALAFAFLYGAGNGLITITRGTLPLALFDRRTYGAFVGRLLGPSFVVSAAAPIIYSTVISHFGDRAALGLSIGAGACALTASAILFLRFGRRVSDPASIRRYR